MTKNKLLVACLTMSSIFFSCTKVGKDVSNDTLQVSEEKQQKNIQFSNYTFEQQNKTNVSGNYLVATEVGATAHSPKIELNQFKTAAPFISVYGVFNGIALDKENIKIEFSGSEDGNKWEDWIVVSPNFDADATSDNLTFNNVELNKTVHFVKFKLTYLNTTAQLSTAKLFFFNPQITSKEEQLKIDEEAARINAEREIVEIKGANISSAVNPALCAKPNFTTRGTWGARAAKSSPSYTTVNFIIVHHEEGSNSSTDWAARVRAVQNLHMDVNGWADIAYNYLVDPNGVAYEGRGGGENVIGAHLCAKNTNTMGICMLGGYTSVLPTNNALYTLKRILAWKCVQRNLNPEATGFHVDRTIFKVSGHRSSCSTDCPGTTLFNFLPNLRADINVNFIAKCK